MSVIPMPASPVPAEIKWALRQPTQVNRSEWTGRRKVTVLAGAPRWMATVTLPVITGESGVLPWRAFFASCQGQANSFRVLAGERLQLATSAIRPTANGQTGTSFLATNFPASQTVLRAGQYITYDDQLLQLTADAVSDANGTARLQFLPYLRVPTLTTHQVVVSRPWALMAMVDDAPGWIVGVGQKYSISFDCEEAF